MGDHQPHPTFNPPEPEEVFGRTYRVSWQCPVCGEHRLVRDSYPSAVIGMQQLLMEGVKQVLIEDEAAAQEADLDTHDGAGEVIRPGLRPA